VTSFILRRLLLGIVVLFLVTILIFVLMHLLPGDPVLLYVGPDYNSFTQEQLDKVRHEYGLDKPLVVQYFDWAGGLFKGDLGRSIARQQSVSSLIAQCLPITINLGVYALIISCILGIAFGVICAIKRGKWPDTLFTVIANLGITLPAFWVGIMLIYLLSIKVNLLPTYGYTSPFDDLWLHFRMLIMPVFCLAIFPIAGLTRQTRSSMLEVTRQDYIRTAWAKGLRERVIITRHMIKNGLIPVITTMGMQVSFMFGGSVLVETVFNIPGMGRMMKDAAMAMDYQAVQGGTLIIAMVIIITNILVDISYGWIDPRIRYN
jgi:peptide/nickel transport system permease protein